ncbi:MAG: hypothetical protein SFY69_06075 [Planctomycetota bacterium]|nr:hypothetical protein [Planctomycetota bacterium]
MIASGTVGRGSGRKSGRAGWCRRVVAAVAAVATAGAAWAQGQPAPLTEDNVIVGTMDIEFATRTNLDTTGKLKEGSAALGAKDTYRLKMNVAKTTEFVGEITRRPNLYSRLLGRKEQQAELGYSIDVFALNPNDLKQKLPVGKWVGQVPIDQQTGAYDLSGGAKAERPLRMAIDAVGRAPAFNDTFGGRMMGKAEKKEGLGSITYKRLIGKRELTMVVKQSDPMRFDNLILAKGPRDSNPRTSVTGRLDYDYETGNWFTDGIKMRYQMSGKDVEDTITGTIKWVEDADRAANGKGYYEFNLRFNEEANRTPTSDAAPFEEMSSEDAFFAVDNSVPCLKGRIEYADTLDADGNTIASKVTYGLHANKLTSQQIMNFFKLWMIAVGPTNDE